ncbi:hypothetical protein [Lysinibacillus capsici]|uniref:hypothetical protein n=1 Tax=Lysinibacillus capsici TaxID=2115968 RepID=UPI002DB9932B|nr:hypothetical protein [Lysinibacillus capsici]MEC1305791.1 hypothetical protein [Lysinibacillus capsici]
MPQNRNQQNREKSRPQEPDVQYNAMLEIQTMESSIKRYITVHGDQLNAAEYHSLLQMIKSLEELKTAIKGVSLD